MALYSLWTLLSKSPPSAGQGPGLTLERRFCRTRYDAILSGCATAAQMNPTVEVIRRKVRVLLVTAQSLETEEDYGSAWVN